MTKELTVIGGTGHLSTRLVRRLLDRGVRIRLIARNPAKAEALFEDTVTVVYGDVSRPDTLEAALQGTSALYIHLNTERVDPNVAFYTEREGVQNVVAAAEAAGVAHIIQIAGIEAAHPEFFDAGILESHTIREVGMNAVAASPIPHTFLTCSFFLDSLPELASNGSLVVFGDQYNTVFFTNTEQLAEHLFHVIGNPAAFGRAIPVQGREGLDFRAGAERFFATYDPDVAVLPIPISAIESLGIPESTADYLRHLYEVVAGLQEVFVAEDIHDAFGTPPSDIDAFAATLREEHLRPI